MSVRFVYVDESHDEHFFCLSALSIRHSHWRECFHQIRAHRQQLKDDFGIFLRKEIHAHKFLGGRGQISTRIISKWERSRIFCGLLQLTASLPEVILFNVCLRKNKHEDPQLVAWDRLINRIERTLLEMERKELPERKSVLSKLRSTLSEKEFGFIEKRILDYKTRAFIIADEGREIEIERIIRKMNVFNPIPSRFGTWESGARTKSIPVDHIIEDPAFKRSERSYFIQLVDCVAHALLKRETVITPRVEKYGIHKMFEENLKGICFKNASYKDPLGIVRQ